MTRITVLERSTSLNSKKKKRARLNIFKKNYSSQSQLLLQLKAKSSLTRRSYITNHNFTLSTFQATVKAVIRLIFTRFRMFPRSRAHKFAEFQRKIGPHCVLRCGLSYVIHVPVFTFSTKRKMMPCYKHQA